MTRKLLSSLLALLGLGGTAACGQQMYADADADAFEALAKTVSIQLVDVRTTSEYAEGHIDGAVNIDVQAPDFLQRAQAQLSAESPVAVYCRSGRRSASAAKTLAGAGFTVTNLTGGIQAWQKAQKPVMADAYTVDLFRSRSGKTVRLSVLLHASVRIGFDGKEIQVDPVRQLGDRSVAYDRMPKADIILVTHEHRDHFDEAALSILTADGTRLVANARCAGMLGRGETMANGDAKKLGDDISVEAVPAYNITEGHTQYHPKGRDNGYVLTLDGLRIYIAGDTEDIPEMSALKDIDVALLPCNQPFTMTPEQLVRAACIIKPKVLLPYHYGQTDVSALPGLLEADGIQVRVREDGR